jgi:hypothetical protein
MTLADRKRSDKLVSWKKKTIRTVPHVYNILKT